MSRFARIRRRPDHWASTHERARSRAAERLDGPLGLAEATWLEGHLAACPACARVAAAYDADRLALRGLREQEPQPPRDLWARTAAAIERESRAAGRTPAPGGSRGGRLPLGVLSGVAVIAVVVAVTAVSGGLFDGIPGTGIALASASPDVTVGDVPAASASAEVAMAASTPFDVGAGDVAWLGKSDDGNLDYNAAAVQKVCPVDNAESCAILDPIGERLALTGSPKSIIGSPTEGKAVVVTDDGLGGQRITVLALPTADPTPAPTVPPTSTPPASEVATPSASGAPASSPPVDTSASEEPTAEPTPSVEPTSSGAATPSVEPTASDEPNVTPSDEPLASATPTLTPEPTVAASLAIANDIAVVGESAAFSPDGSWFAFTARPVDGTGGPDVYVWKVGDERASQLTEGGATVFASWDDGAVVASRADTTAGEDTVVARTVLIDPASGDERQGGDLWRPVVDPTADRAVAWTGTLRAGADGRTIQPSEGQLELRAWSSEDGSSSGTGPSQVVADGTITDFDVRWDETGAYFATWVADPTGNEAGRLTLFHVDPSTGRLEHPEGAPTDVAAMPGFSIGEGRLAWATPPGQGGEGSRVQIVAWTQDGVGTVETAPGEELVVVR